MSEQSRPAELLPGGSVEDEHGVTIDSFAVEALEIVAVTTDHGGRKLTAGLSPEEAVALASDLEEAAAAVRRDVEK